MPPSTVVGIVFLIAALSPGVVYHRVIARFVPRDARSTVVEVVELATIGAAASATAALTVLAVGEAVPWLLSAAQVAGDPAMLRARPWSVVVSVVSTLVTSYTLAAAAGWLRARRARADSSRLREGSAWSVVLSRKRDGLPAFLAVELDDGRLIEGVFRHVSIGEEPARDTLVLRPPIAVSGPGDAPRAIADEDFVVIPRTIVKAIHGKYLTPKQATEED